METVATEIVAPAPWTLRGSASVARYRLAPGAEHARPSRGPTDPLAGRLALVMLVEYTESPVGPYNELLVAVGRLGRGPSATVPQIWVDSPSSLRGGRSNWAIPKELGSFEREDSGRVRVRDASGDLLLDVTTGSRGPSLLPVPLAVVPRPLRTLWQPGEDGWRVSSVGGSGWAGLGTWEVHEHRLAGLGGAILKDAWRVSRFAIHLGPSRAGVLPG